MFYRWPENFINMLTKYNDSSKEYSMKIIKNTNNILIVPTLTNSDTIIENKKFEIVQCFTYLERKIIYNGKNETNIKSTICILHFKHSDYEYHKKSYKTSNCMEYNNTLVTYILFYEYYLPIIFQ